MPRPAFSPDAAQRRTLAALARQATRLADEDRRLSEMIAEAVHAGVPVSVVADAVGVERKTVYRRLGRPMR